MIKKEVIFMYRADRCDGQTIILSNQTWQREKLEQMRTDYKFYCPDCSEQVVLKLGACQSWHFAHRPSSICVSARTNESLEHFQAKHAIYDWLKSFQLKPDLELYLPEVKRRPDLCVKINQKSVVIELQRSHIHPDQFYKRHFTYLDAGYHPVWIGLQSTIPIIPLSLKTFTQLDSFLIKFKPVPHSIYFNLTHQKWFICSGFSYLQPRKTLQWITQLPLGISPEELIMDSDKFTLQRASDKKRRNDFLLERWKVETLIKRTKVFLSFNPSERKMLNVFQQYQLNLNYFPAVCNFPQTTQYLLDTPPQLWQSWLVIEVINKASLHQNLHLSTVSQLFKHICDSFHFTLRPSTIHYKEMIRLLVREYFNFLCCFNILDQIFPGVYKVLHHVTLNKSLHTLIQDDEYVMNQIKKYFESENK